MLKKEKCERTIPHDKRDKPNFQSRRWWHRLFKALEEEAAIPPEKRFEVLNAIFPEALLMRVVRLITLNEKNRKAFEGLHNLEFLCEGPLTFPPIVPSSAYLYDKRKQDDVSSYGSSLSSSTSSQKGNPLKQVGKNNPYLKFFKTRPDRVSIWRPMPPLALADMNLVQKADAITERIAVEFVEWLQQMGGESTSNLTVQTIISMFEIGFNTHAAKSLCVRLKELPTVSDLMAKKKNVPEMAKRKCLLRQIHRDVKASKKEPRRIAFGKALPSYLQSVPNKEDIAKKWLECQNVPIKLKTMQTVWEGITHLRSTRAYCEWLVNHPEITPPQFLVENNMLDLVVLHTHRLSFDDEELVEEIAAASDLIIKDLSGAELVDKLDTGLSKTEHKEIDMSEL